jgi:hypothetical protein
VRSPWKEHLATAPRDLRAGGAEWLSLQPFEGADPRMDSPDVEIGVWV